MSAALAILVKGGPVMVPLLACSIISLAVILERAWFWRRHAGAGDAERSLAFAQAGKLDEALEVSRASRSPVARVLAAGLEHRGPAATLGMEAAARSETRSMRRYLGVLDTVVTLSPLLGLLGTVTGMIGAFGVMASTGINQPHAITGGVAEALIATAAGLGVAIATLVAHNYFAHRVDSALEEMEHLGTQLELVLREVDA